MVGRRSRGLAGVLLLGATALTGTFWQRSAAACSCVPRGTYISPSDGASNVPLNAIVFTSRSASMSWPLKLVQVDTGAEVPTTGHGGRRQVAGQLVYEYETMEPNMALLPNTKYEV